MERVIGAKTTLREELDIIINFLNECSKDGFHKHETEAMDKFINMIRKEWHGLHNKLPASTHIYSLRDLMENIRSYHTTKNQTKSKETSSEVYHSTLSKLVKDLEKSIRRFEHQITHIYM